MSAREWSQLKYLNSEQFLIGFRKMYNEWPVEKLPRDLASLRHRDVRHMGEARRCALFCYGVGQLLGIKVSFAEYEKSDYDYITAYVHNGSTNFVPVQMKEFVPVSINPAAELQSEINKLRKYCDSSDLVVAIHLNRTGYVRLSELDFSNLRLKELWFFGARTDSQDEWVVIGNLLKRDAVWHDFRYPQS